MKVDIYRLVKKTKPRENTFIFVPASKEQKGLPQKLIDRYGEGIYEKSIDINSSDRRIAVDSKKAILSIEEQGYHLQEATITK